MSQIKIGRQTFSTEYLRSLTLTEAKAHYRHVKPEVVKEAYYIANPKKKRKSKDQDA